MTLIRHSYDNSHDTHTTLIRHSHDTRTTRIRTAYEPVSLIDDIHTPLESQPSHGQRIPTVDDTQTTKDVHKTQGNHTSSTNDAEAGTILAQTAPVTIMQQTKATLSFRLDPTFDSSINAPCACAEKGVPRRPEAPVVGDASSRTAREGKGATESLASGRRDRGTTVLPPQHPTTSHTPTSAKTPKPPCTK